MPDGSTTTDTPPPLGEHVVAGAYVTDEQVVAGEHRRAARLD